MEEPLLGGNMSSVSRVGDEVRRGAGPWTATVHDLLRHVRARGISFVPEPRGTDAVGRETLGFIEGTVPAYPMPEWVWQDPVVGDAGRLLRRYHDGTVDFGRAGRRWQFPPHAPDEVICHNDFAPYNLVFRGRSLVGVIDFDTASPGPRVRDLSYLAYRLVPLAASTNPDAVATGDGVRARRLRRLCAAYGDGMTPAAVLGAASGRVEELAAFTAARASGSGGPAALADHVSIYRADAAYIRTHRAALLEAR